MIKVVIEADNKLLNSLPHITDVQPISDQDFALLTDIREVLEKHGALHRFGLQLLHKHYDLCEGEILQETTDEDGRISEIKPILKEKFDDKLNKSDVTYTTVLFNQQDSVSGVVTLACAVSCASHSYGKVHNVT
jgi:hypothetical protein